MLWLLLLASAPALPDMAKVKIRYEALLAFNACSNKLVDYVFQQRDTAEVLADAVMDMCGAQWKAFEDATWQATSDEADARQYMRDRRQDVRRHVISELVMMRSTLPTGSPIPPK